MSTGSARTVDGGDDLAARYGRRPPRRRALGVLVAAGVLVVAALVWLVWAQPWSGQQFWKTTGYSIQGDSAIEVAFTVTLSEGAQAKCALAATNAAYAIIGWKIVDIAGGTAPTQHFTELVRTTQRADSGLVYRCWLP